MNAKNNERNKSKVGAQLCGKAFSKMAVAFSTMACCGKLYETKVPKELRK